MDDDLYREKAILAQKVQVFHSCNDMLPNQAKTKQDIHSNNSKKFGVHKATIHRWFIWRVKMGNKTSENLK